MVRTPTTPHEYWQLFLKRKLSFLIPFIGVTFLSAFLAFELPNIYRSTTMILVEPQKVPENYVRPTVTARVEDRLKTITQQILSQTRLEKIIQAFHLYSGKDQDTRVKKLLARIPGLGSYWGLAALDPDTAIERMRKDIEVKVKGDNVFTISYQGLNPDITMQVTDKLASLFISENLRIREQQAEGTSEFLENELQQTREQMEKQERQVKEFKERYMGELPEQLEANLRALDRFQLELKSTVETLETKEITRKSGRSLLPESGGQAPNLNSRLEQLRVQLSNLEAQYNPNYPDVAVTRKEIKEIEEALARRERPASTERDKGFLNSRLEQLRVRLSNLQAQYGPDYPDVAMTRKEIKEIEEAKARRERPASTGKDSGLTPFQDPEIAMLMKRRDDLLRQIALYEKRVENTPAREQELTTIMRDYETIRKNYQSLLDKRLEARISENLEKRQQGEIFRILDPANYPLLPYKPNRLLMLILGVIAAAVGGIGLVFLREMADQTFTTDGDLSEVVGIPVLACIPRHLVQRRYLHVNLRPRGVQTAISQTSSLIKQKAMTLSLEQYGHFVQDSSSAVVEQFRVLHGSLEKPREMKMKRCRIICITSAVSGEGKSFIASNLAMVMARDYGKKTLLMDMDCAKAMYQRIKRQDSGDLGWADTIQGKVEVDMALLPFLHENIFTLRAGTVDQASSSLIKSLGASNLLRILRENFDFIVMDAAPVFPLADMQFLEKLVDEMIFVVRAAQTTRDLVMKACRSLRREKIRGVVLNDIKYNLHPYYYYDHCFKLSHNESKVRSELIPLNRGYRPKEIAK